MHGNAVSHPGVDQTGTIPGVRFYLGYNLFSVTGALVTIRRGGLSGGVIDTVALDAGESARAWYGPEGIAFDGEALGIVVESGDLSALSTLRLIQADQ